ncbi:phosphohydrolase [Candidatus Peregrinibacteria bacterium CG10_big_fil_rev_8_21_14_0_10_36_19]|nr:MAG: phosphohydrolase [Candidatus Peregrinibacteria bacterium CG10_big_fil_rev_8_21_14_0_10_36_19]
MKSTSIEIIEILKNAGHQAFWAGGCVRDMLIGIKPKDFDIVTSAKPDEIEALLDHTIPIGKEYGVILSINNGHHFEIATFRSDSGYSDGRRPDAIEFTNAEEDAKRRDFTINAIFYDPLTEEIFDYVGGQKDMQDKLIRFIGEPEKRILEDHLRILRAVRFKNAYGMQYHPDTYQAIKKYVHLVEKVSPERIRDELNKMITGANPAQAFEELFEIGALEILMPELCKLKGLAQPLMYHQEGDVWDHSLRALSALTDEESDPNPLPATPPSIELKWATLMHDIGKFETFGADAERIRYDNHASVGANTAKNILQRLKFPKKSIERIVWLIEHHMMIVQLLEMPEGRRRHWFLNPGFEELLEVYRADSMGIVPLNLDLYHQLKKLYHHEIAELKLMPKQIITGEEVMEISGLKPGEKVGEILEQIREKQLSGEVKTPEDAKEFLKNIL